MSENLFKNKQSVNDNLAKLNLKNDRLDFEESGFSSDLESKYVIFRIHQNIFAINSKYVQLIEPTPPTTTEISQASPEIRGVTYYKEQAINLVDLRKVLGIISQKDYLTNVVDLPQRIKEHIKFVEKLEDEVINDKEITVTDDPHACTFGKWIDSFKPVSIILKNEIERIIEPHELLHKTVIQIRNAMESNKKEDALNFLDAIKNDYSRDVIEKLNNLEKLLNSEIYELSIIIRIGNKTVGIIVDETQSVEPIDKIERLPEIAIVNKYVKNYGLRNKDGSLILILEASAFA